MSNTGTSIAIIESHVRPLWSRFDDMVSPVGLSAKRWLQTCLLAVEKNGRLAEYPVQEHLRWINTSATLGLEPDGALGQLFAIPFGGKNACIQPVIGYKGMNTMAGRAGIAIHGDVLREGDQFDPTISAGDPFRVKVAFGHRQTAPIIGAWAQGELPNGRFTTPVLMDLSELLAVKMKSPGAKKYDSPWNDTDGPGFAAMCSKSAKRRLQRHLPALLTVGLESHNVSQHALGGTLDTLHEEKGSRTWIDDKHQVVEGGQIDSEEGATSEKAGSKNPFRILRPNADPLNCASIEEWREKMLRGIAAAPSSESIDSAIGRHATVFDELWQAGHEKSVQAVRDAAELKKGELSK